jgi:hypothetical protein
MNIEMNEGYNIIYAKKMGRPKNIYFNTRIEVVEFFLENLNDIDLLSINDVIIDTKKLVNDNIHISRYLKLKKINSL